jgi:hypothetical protein
MVLNDFVSEWEKLPRLLRHFLPIFRPTPVDGFPVTCRCWGISRPSIWAFPPASVNIFAPAEQAPEKSDPLPAPFRDCGRSIDGSALFSCRRIFRQRRWNYDMVLQQELT